MNKLKLKLCCLCGMFMSAIILIYQNIIFPCTEEWYVFVLLGASFILFPISLNKLLKLFNVKYTDAFWTGVVSLAIFIYAYRKGIDVTNNEIDTNGGIVKVAIVYKKYFNVRTPRTIYVHYNVDGKRNDANYVCKKHIYDKIAIGDTILIVHSLRCPTWNLPYKFLPTSKEKQKCKDGCLLKNGKLLLVD